jgi:hypothetical protein
MFSMIPWSPPSRPGSAFTGQLRAKWRLSLSGPWALTITTRWPRSNAADVATRRVGTTISLPSAASPSARRRFRRQISQIERAALRQSAGKLGVADELGAVVLERGGTEDMVGMHMRQNDEANRPIGNFPDRRAQTLALARAAAGSTTSTEVSPTMKPTLAIASSFAALASSGTPA